MIRACFSGGRCVELVDDFAYRVVLKACASNSLIGEGKAVHGIAIKGGFGSGYSVQAALVDMYGRCGRIDAARKVFDEMPVRGLFCWSYMMFAYKQSKKPEHLLALYQKMKHNGVHGDSVIMVNVASAVAQLRNAELSQAAHGGAVKQGFVSDLYVQAAMVDMYAKCGKTDEARKIFNEVRMKDSVCWTAMITAYEQTWQPRESLLLFRMMQQHGVFADLVTLISVASAVGQMGWSAGAKSVHAYAVASGFINDVSVGNSLVAMYAKCGNIEKARSVFDWIGERDLVSWNSMLSGYAHNGLACEALALLDDMLDSGCKPNSVTALVVVSVCADLGSLQLAREIRDFIINNEIKIDTNLRNAIMDMYAKCGDLDTAGDMFSQIHPSERDVKLWNVLILGYGMHGYGEKALEFYSQMKEEGIQPDHITFVSVLSACSHAGLVDEGRKSFADMTKYSVTSEVKHYACMVDMLGRAGFLHEAYDLVKTMPMEPDDSVRGAFLLACRIHGDAEFGEIAADDLFRLNPEHSGHYVLISSIKATSNRWEEAYELRREMKDKGLNKPAALSVLDTGK